MSETTGNLDINDSDELTPLNFKVPLDFHTDFKSYATRRRITMKRLLEESFREYEQNHPLGP